MSTITLKTAYRRTSVSKLKIRAAVKAAYSEKTPNELATKEQVGKKIDSTAKKVGDKTASTAVKGVAVIKDKVYKGKQAPDGSSVYIDNKDKKYYIDKTGKKIYLKPSQIKNKEE